MSKAKSTGLPQRDASRLAADILKLLMVAPRQTADQLAETFGFNPSTVRVRLNVMLDLGQIDYIEAPGKTTAARKVKQWSIVDVDAPDQPRDASYLPERRISTKHYPLVDRRDPLVAALFGQAGAQP
jgi:DNA-binding Lrp family transcriptional regulator